jgi:acyl carrier protein
MDEGFLDDDGSAEAAIVRIVCRIANLARLDPTQDYFDAGLESVQALELLVELESRFGINLSDEEFARTRTVRDLGRLVTAGKASG